MFLFCIGWVLEMKEEEYCFLKRKKLTNINQNLPAVQLLVSTFLNLLLLCRLYHGADLLILFIFS